MLSQLLRSLFRRSSSASLSFWKRARASFAVVTRVEAQPRLGRARASRGSESGGDPGPFRPTSATHKILFSTTNTFVSVHSGPHFPRDPGTTVSRRRPASAVRASARVISSARTPHGVPLVSLSFVLRAVGTSPAPAHRTNREPTIGAPRETARPPRGSTPDAFHSSPPPAGVRWNRPERVARPRAPWSRGDRASDEDELLQFQPTRWHLSRASGPRSVMQLPSRGASSFEEHGRAARGLSLRCRASLSPLAESAVSAPARRWSWDSRFPRCSARPQSSLAPRNPLVHAPTSSSPPRDLRRMGPPPRPRGDPGLHVPRRTRRPDAFHRRARQRAGARSRGHLTLSSKAARLFDRRLEAP